MDALKQIITRHRKRAALPRTKPILRALRRIDEARDQLRRAEQNMNCLFAPAIEEDGEDLSRPALEALRAAWAEFQREGGVTALDFERWLTGAPLRRLKENTISVRCHLRLVASNKVQRASEANRARSFVYRGPRDDPPEVA